MYRELWCVLKSFRATPVQLLGTSRGPQGSNRSGATGLDFMLLCLELFHFSVLEFLLVFFQNNKNFRLKRGEVGRGQCYLDDTSIKPHDGRFHEG